MINRSINDSYLPPIFYNILLYIFETNQIMFKPSNNKIAHL